jgi:hypothetical protein
MHSLKKVIWVISDTSSACLNLNIKLRAGLQLRKALSYDKDEVPTFYIIQKDKNIMYVSVELHKIAAF